MYSIVKRLRQRGLRKHDRDIQSDQGATGDLTLTLGGDGAQLKLSSDDGSRQEPIIPVLLDARLITMHHDKMLFRGIERGEGGAEFVQEWSVLVLAGSKTG
jgi:hypothetical protein